MLAPKKLAPTTTLVVTSIAPPTASMTKLAEGASKRGIRFICIGDRASPVEYELADCDYYSISRQNELKFQYTLLAPERHYARKNIGYLLAIRSGADRIIETDDDNSPLDDFWCYLANINEIESVTGSGWYNVYEYFGTDAWPRGFPLQCIKARNQEFSIVLNNTAETLIQQGLVAGEPDVDAIFRLTRPNSVQFKRRKPLLLDREVWSPFNSQNTQWLRLAFPLLYLPATCSFRATDIIRGYVALRCLWELGSGIAYVAPTAVQDRNPHDLMRDFTEEFIIYKKAGEIAAELNVLDLSPGPEEIIANIKQCYRVLVKLEVVSYEELQLLDAWCDDIEGLSQEYPN